ncbi:hypothetical protein [Spartinivicinus poritis]|uniref:Uncharacterized protein n=1 Tax=Spartinivicinus poritis TaxID=2994640 RepID=A0ABT5U6F9_9GAMM|nr:hypothetical protein [Spartinivicinus sp. A2-2]MDE1460769.1 hypothetical protein [Spartinivicinus sp. A2-2]
MLELDSDWLLSAIFVSPWKGKGVDAVHPVVTAIVSHQGLSAILKQCIDYTGDVDTVATIALAAV